MGSPPGAPRAVTPAPGHIYRAGDQGGGEESPWQAGIAIGTVGLFQGTGWAGRKPSESLGPVLKLLLEVEERSWNVKEKKQEAERSIFQIMI